MPVLVDLAQLDELPAEEHSLDVGPGAEAQLGPSQVPLIVFPEERRGEDAARSHRVPQAPDRCIELRGRDEGRMRGVCAPRPPIRTRSTREEGLRGHEAARPACPASTSAQTWRAYWMSAASTPR